jgi:AmiR/NasT family two-component response regulator
MLITGRLDPRIVECANQLGVTAVLEKPFSVSRLVDLVRVAMDRDQCAAAMKRS